jgi:hypothetical protein
MKDGQVKMNFEAVSRFSRVGARMEFILTLARAVRHVMLKYHLTAD